MKISDFSYLSADDKSVIHGVLWEPDTKVRGVIQISHGITEHMGRYEGFARFFTEKGFAVCGNDHLGHGLSSTKPEAFPMYFGEAGSHIFVEDDILMCNKYIKETFPELPVCLLGFSLGSFAVRSLISRRPDAADMYIFAGTGQMSVLEIALGRMMAKKEEKAFGDTCDTADLHKLTMGTYNKYFEPCRTDADWLCANEDAIDEYLQDPLCGNGFTVSSFRELLNMAKICTRARCYDRLPDNIPLLFVSGENDPVGKMGKGVKKACKMLERAGFRDVEMRLFAGMRHDIFHEKDYLKVFEAIDSWLDERV